MKIVKLCKAHKARRKYTILLSPQQSSWKADHRKLVKSFRGIEAAVKHDFKDRVDNDRQSDSMVIQWLDVFMYYSSHQQENVPNIVTSQAVLLHQACF